MFGLNCKLGRKLHRVSLVSLGVIAAISFASFVKNDDRVSAAPRDRAVAKQHHGMSMVCSSNLKCDRDNTMGNSNTQSNLPTPVTSATVTIESFQFTPNNIKLKKGGKVTFINKDTTPHTVTPEMGSKFVGTGRLANNESKTIVFDNVGVQNYFCEIHPSMMGQITVVD
jgi:plastocyanin